MTNENVISKLNSGFFNIAAIAKDANIAPATITRMRDGKNYEAATMNKIRETLIKVCEVKK